MTRGRLLLLLCAAALSFALVSCNGDDSGDSSTRPPGAETQTDGERTQAERDATSCNARGINVRDGNEGTCRRGDKDFTLVNKDSTLELDEIEVEIADVSEPQRTIRSSAGTVEAGENQKKEELVFVAIELKVTNRDDARHRISDKQFRLKGSSGGGRRFARAEDLVADSFTNNERAIAPDRSQTATAIFKVKSETADALELRGADSQLLVWNFSTAEADKPGPPDGAIRLWQ